MGDMHGRLVGLIIPVNNDERIIKLINIRVIKGAAALLVVPFDFIRFRVSINFDSRIRYFWREICYN